MRAERFTRTTVIVTMTRDEYEKFLEFKGRENSKKSLIAQMKLQQRQAKELSREVLAALETCQVFNEEARERAIEIAKDILT